MKAIAITYKVDDESGCIDVGLLAPFDGAPCLIRLSDGWVEAYWDKQKTVTTVDGSEVEGFCWACMDYKFSADLDDAKFWSPLPEFEAAPTLTITNCVFHNNTAAGEPLPPLEEK